jgi:hypothetical protein
MKLTIWDVLSIVLLVGTVLVVVFVLQIYNNPTSALNPFPPSSNAGLPTLLVLPTRTNTPLKLPATWTPTPRGGVPPTDAATTLRPTWTPLPTSTGFVIPTWTPTITLTPTRTITRTPTNTPTRTPVPPTATLNLTATYQSVVTQISGGQTATAAVATANAVATSNAQTPKP